MRPGAIPSSASDRETCTTILQLSLEIIDYFPSGKVAEKPLPLYKVFAAYAAGLGVATRNLALNLKPIRINQVNPGAVITKLWGEGAEERIEATARMALLGKMTTPKETAEAYIYLMKDTTAT